MPHVKREKNNIKFRFILTAFLLIAGVFVINNSSLAATGLQVGTGSLILGGAENLYYGNISASSATTSNLLLLQNGGVSKFTVDYYGIVRVKSESAQPRLINLFMFRAMFPLVALRLRPLRDISVLPELLEILVTSMPFLRSV